MDVVEDVSAYLLVLCCSKPWAYSSTIFNTLVWSTEFPFMVKLVTNFPFLGVKCHICDICDTLFLSQGHGHTLVLLWSTSFGISPFLEYPIWLWSQPGVLTLVISCNHINPGVLDWVSRGLLGTW